MADVLLVVFVVGAAAAVTLSTLLWFYAFRHGSKWGEKAKPTGEEARRWVGAWPLLSLSQALVAPEPAKAAKSGFSLECSWYRATFAHLGRS
jgi:hypothetical protein